MSDKKLAEKIRQGFGRIEAERGWQARLDRLERHLDNLPDQRRIIEEKDGDTITKTTGPRAEIERHIKQARRTGEAGDLDGFAQAMHRIVSDFWEAGIPLFLDGDYRQRQQAAARRPRKREAGLVLRALGALVRDRPSLSRARLVAELEAEPLTLDHADVEFTLRESGVEVRCLVSDRVESIRLKNVQRYIYRAKKRQVDT